eukprot:4266947-Pleurochrysis_carterae.AAC.4
MAWGGAVLRSGWQERERGGVKRAPGDAVERARGIEARLRNASPRLACTAAFGEKNFGRASEWIAVVNGSRTTRCSPS